MHLFLVGPPGIGKSTVAPLLAGMLGASVFEIDRAVLQLRGNADRLSGLQAIASFRALAVDADLTRAQQFFQMAVAERGKVALEPAVEARAGVVRLHFLRRRDARTPVRTD